MNKTIGQQIRQQRIQKGITQGELAKLIGCTSANICKMEKGDHRVRLIHVPTLANLLNIPLETFFIEERSGIDGQKADI
ncbi:helix-turn-helix transcriptional regulator [Heliorestis convoluta]|uniref:Helix-turn-helix domain protein n=1 Tax=Heliorestis convoluta TaxID=356322 RepID=A0A5Q2N2A8_9FIRM|nr:helix-turn-helix transcriptional regulator [Heliorestis convoluta]QGG48957.1 helix-turn-helix domain protein [Heliorestis convoluta]